MHTHFRSYGTRMVVFFMAALMMIVGAVPQVDAGFISNSQSSFNRQADMASVQNVLENKLVKERLKALGYSQDEIQARLNMLSDEEIHQLSAQIDSLAPAGDGLGVIISVLVIIILVLVILQLTGKRVVIT